MFEKLFKLEANGTNVKTELVAGITTFITPTFCQLPVWMLAQSSLPQQ